MIRVVFNSWRWLATNALPFHYNFIKFFCFLKGSLFKAKIAICIILCKFWVMSLMVLFLPIDKIEMRVFNLCFCQSCVIMYQGSLKDNSAQRVTWWFTGILSMLLMQENKDPIFWHIYCVVNWFQMWDLWKWELV